MRLSIIYSFLCVATIHLMVLIMLARMPSPRSASPFITLSEPMMTATFLNTAPLSSRKQTLPQIYSSTTFIAPAIPQKKGTETAIKPRLLSASNARSFSHPAFALSPLLAPPTLTQTQQPIAATPSSISALNNAATLPTKQSQLAHPPRTEAHLDCRIAPVRYPVLARQHGESGTTLIKMRVSTYGVIEQATILRSSGSPRLDAAARTAALASTCHPYRVNGQPLQATTHLRFQFNLHR